MGLQLGPWVESGAPGWFTRKAQGRPGGRASAGQDGRWFVYNDDDGHYDHGQAADLHTAKSAADAAACRYGHTFADVPTAPARDVPRGWVRLTGLVSGSTFWVQTRHVVSVMRADNEPGTRVLTVEHPEPYRVTETPEQVMALIEAAS